MTAPEDHPDRVVTLVLVDDGGGVRGGLEERFEMIAGSDRYDAGLEQRFELIAECGIGDGLVHGDFHPGNVRAEAFAFFDRPWFART